MRPAGRLGALPQKSLCLPFSPQEWIAPLIGHARESGHPVASLWIPAFAARSVTLPSEFCAIASWRAERTCSSEPSSWRIGEVIRVSLTRRLYANWRRIAVSKDSFRLPGQDLDELESTVKAYRPIKEALSTQELTKRTPAPKGQYSKNVGFLVDFGVLEEQPKFRYKLTSPGQKLANALHGEHPDHRAWLEILKSSRHLDLILHPLIARLPEGMYEEELVQSLFQMATRHKQIEKLTVRYDRGAKTLIAVLIEAGIVKEKDNKLVLIPKDEWGSSDNNASPTIPDIDWSFVTNEKLKKLLARDYGELKELREGGKNFALKSKLVLCGSILEAVLVSILSNNEQSAKDQYKTLDRQQKSPDGKALVRNESQFYSLIIVVQKSGISDAQLITDILKDYWKLVQEKHQDPKVPPLDEWKFYQLIEVSHKLHLLNRQQKHIADYLRDNRNFVHLMSEIESDESTLEPSNVEAVLNLFVNILKHLSKPETSKMLIRQNAIVDHD